MTDFIPEEHLGRIIVQAKSLLSQNLLQAFKENGFDITVEQWAILIILWEEDGISQVQLAERALKDKPTTTRMLKILEREGIIVRKRDESDLRAYKVYLSEAGRKGVDSLLPLAKEVLQKAERNLTEQEVEDLKRMLKILISNLS